jgi:tetratricopeptide (TPR) repeat protein
MHHTCLRSRPAVPLLFLWLALGFAVSRAAGTPAVDDLARAWTEYQFQSFDLAKSFFESAQLTGTAEEKLQAKTGLAMVAQFNERGADLDKAEALYREVLAAGATGEHALLVRNFLADIHISRGQKAEAMAILDELVDAHLGTVIGQDALIRRVLLTLGEYKSPESLAAAAEAAKRLADVQGSRERPCLLPTLNLMLGDIYFWAGDHATAVGFIENFTTVGTVHTTSYGNQASQLYRLARLYETSLKDPARAGHFYRRLVEETPNSGMSYFSLEKAVALGAFTRQEVGELRMGGLTPALVDELFRKAGRE